MKDPKEPICTFGRTRQALHDTLGIEVDEAGEAYVVVKPHDVTLGDVAAQRVTFDPTGIYFTTPEGRRLRGFMYMKEYDVDRYPEGPRAHICECVTIQDFKQMHRFQQFVWANAEPVPVVNRNTGRIVDHRRLPICKNCIRVMSAPGAGGQPGPGVNNTTAFVDYLKSLSADKGGRGDDKAVDVDILGYVREWPQISQACRQRADYTCERCGAHIDSLYDRHYMQVHHRDGDKLNNSDGNLQCLCIACHAQVDDAHRHNFGRGANLEEVKAYYEQYAGQMSLEMRKNTEQYIKTHTQQ